MSSSKSQSSSINDKLMNTDSSTIKCSRAAGHSGGIEKSNDTQMLNKNEQSQSGLGKFIYLF